MEREKGERISDGVVVIEKNGGGGKDDGGRGWRL